MAFRVSRTVRLGPSSAEYHLARRRRWAGLALLFATAVLLLPAPVFAADPSYLAGMPTPEHVSARVRGTDAFDTAARQYVAFDNLFGMIDMLIGDRMVAGQMTPPEKALRDAYNDGRSLVLRDLKESLPPEQRDFYVGTRFAEWSALRDRYYADAAFGDQAIAALFSTAFRAEHAQILRDAWLHSGGLGLTPTPRPDPAGDFMAELRRSVPIVALILIGFMIPLLVKRGRLAVDPKDAFRLHLGGSTYSLRHRTGRVENATKMGTTDVYGYGGGGRDGYSAPITVSSSTTVHDQFFLREADGHLESVQLKAWDFPVADGHVASAVSAFSEGSNTGTYIVLRNHTTLDASCNRAYLVARLYRGGYAAWWLQHILWIVAGLAMSPILGLPVALGAAAGGAFLGTLVRHYVIKARIMRRFERAGLPRIYAELDRSASRMTEA